MFKERIYDLEERTFLFAESVVRFLRENNIKNKEQEIHHQLAKSATSVGANYMEASGAESKKDFIHKISVCKKESKETMYWLRLLSTAQPAHKEALRTLWKEAHELTLIFSKSISSAKENNND